MSAPRKDGGPAFPRSGFELSRSDFSQSDTEPQDGMTLRDWFAGQALQSYLAGRNIDSRDSNTDAAAKVCYKYADAMLAARGQKKSAT